MTKFPCHTSTPWYIDNSPPEGVERGPLIRTRDTALNAIAEVYDEANAALIIRAVNNIDRLEAALEALVNRSNSFSMLLADARSTKGGLISDEYVSAEREAWRVEMEEARAALAELRTRGGR